jgi:predicted TIM-barrel fold metal-dependent hydrolase
MALARLMNEQAAAYVAAHPDKLSFYAVVPLPYTQEAITEALYALNHLGAAGIFLQSNFEGRYLGDTGFTPFFQAINNLGGRQVLFIHPSAPYLKIGSEFVECNPTNYPTGNVEFYFETGRTLMDLTLTQTIHNFTNIHYVIPHTGGSFPAILDRFLKTNPPLYAPSMAVYASRFWWDSAGPTYYHQVAGLLGYGFPKSQLLFGTDFPYAPAFTQGPSLDAILASTLLTEAEKIALFTTNAHNLFAGIITF